MWDYQPHFRAAFRATARAALDALEPGLRPEVLLVGVRRWGKLHPVSIEPEGSLWDVSLFEGLHQDLERRLNDERTSRARHPGHHGAEERELQARILREVVEARLRGVDQENETRSFCGPPTVVSEYEVVPVVVVDGAAYESFPRLDTGRVAEEEPELRLASNFVDAAIQELLLEASFALLLPEAGHYPGELFRRSRMEVLREAARTLMWSASVVSVGRPDVGEDLFEAANAVSAATYEALEAVGEILIAPANDPRVDVHIRLHAPVPIRNTVWVRKLLETTRTGPLALLTDGESIYGLGIAKQAVCRVQVLGDQRWQLCHQSQVLVQVAHGNPGLPRARLEADVFKDILCRVLHHVGSSDADVLWELVQAVIQQRQGSLLVVSEEAPDESERLSAQAMCLEPQRLTPEELHALAAMDGAVLLDTHGRCYAAGMILDGMATRHGHPGRGARYNSAVRYVQARPQRSCVAIVVSKDGGVDVVPTLPPRIRRRDVRARVDTLCEQSRHEPDRRRVNEALRWLDAHRAYISSSQAHRINQAVAALERKLSTTTAFSFPYPPFEGPEQIDPRLFGEAA